MKKFNFIIGKRQIMISTLLLILAIAAYLNWLAAGDQSVTVLNSMNKPEQTISQQQTENESKYGEAELVNSKLTTQNETTDYFNQAKMQKEASNAETYEELTKLLESPNTPEEKKAEAADQALKLTEIQKKETEIENQVTAQKNFDKCITYIEKDKVSVTVSVKDEMSEEQAAQIKNIICNVVDVKPYNITITPINSNTTETN